MNSVSNKCDSCKCKLKVINFDCTKCNKKFCTKCRYPEVHKCPYDYRQDKVQLEKVVKDKIDRI